MMSAPAAARPLLTELYPLIVKPRAALRVPPNLTDYDAACRSFTWAAARARLLEFAGILRGWDRKTTASRRGNVEVLCQPEP